MTRIVILEKEQARKCELCGAEEECRPYGPNGEQICFTCGQKDRAATEKRMGQVLFGEGLDS